MIMTDKTSEVRMRDSSPARRKLDAIATTLAFLLAAIGIAANQITPDISYRYWLTAVAVMALMSLVIGGCRAHHHGGRRFFAQLLHWLAVGGTAVAAFLLLRGASLDNQGIALVMMLVLALGTFSDGVRVSWRLAVLGIMLAASVMITLFFPPKTWLMPVLTVAALILVLLLDRRHRHAEVVSHSTFEAETTEEKSEPETEAGLDEEAKSGQDKKTETKAESEKSPDESSKEGARAA